MLTGVTTAAGRRRDRAGWEQGFTLAADGGRLRLAGPLDHENVEDLRGALEEVVGPDPVVLDLTAVSRLPSTAVQALHTAWQGATRRGQELLFYAPPGTTAQHVLELVRLPYVLTDPGP
jgi:anti-anti-sigma regulatory factor